jgi:hypothetical protein
MPFDGWLSTTQIAAVFRFEIAARQGEVRDVHDDGSEIYLRATLPSFDELEPGDWVQGGVALHACADEIAVHPYTLRRICSNGAIIAQGAHSCRLARAGATRFGEAGVTAALRAAIGGACDAAAFLDAASGTRATLAADADERFFLERGFAAMSERVRERLAGILVAEFLGGKDRSLFALMNAVTAAARDEPDPALRWELELLGGAMATGWVGTARRAGKRDAVARVRRAA